VTVRSLKRVPWTVCAYIAIVLALMTLLLGEDDPQAFGGALILLAASAGLLLGLWLAWAFLVALHLATSSSWRLSGPRGRYPSSW
jgi:hypothetical protein